MKTFKWIIFMGNFGYENLNPYEPPYYEEKDEMTEEELEEAQAERVSKLESLMDEVWHE